MVHKGSFYFGPHLWLQVQLNKAKAQEAVTFTPPTLVATASAALSPPAVTSQLISAPPPSAVASPLKQLSNEELLKSIGFLPSDTAPAEVVVSLVDVDCAVEPAGEDTSTSSSTVRLIETFEVIENPAAIEPVVPDQIEASDSGDFVIVLPDCFNLDKPIDSYELQKSQTLESSVVSDPSSASGREDLRDTKPSPSAVKDIPSPNNGKPRSSSNASKEDQVGSAVSSTSSHVVSPSARRKNRGGLFRNPLVVASNFVNAVTVFVDEKVHFAPAKRDSVSEDDPASGSSEEEEFQVRHKLI